MMNMRKLCLLILALTVIATACDGSDGTIYQTLADTNPDTSAGSDAGSGTAPDTGVDTGSDSGTDPDAESDLGNDGGSETGSAGCGGDPTGLAQSLQVGNQTRTFDLYLPADYDPARAYPLVVGLHGGGGTGAGFQGFSGLDEAVGSDAIIVYPDGLPEFPGGDTVWMLDPAAEGFVFFDDLLELLATNLCIDESRVFATGWSMGGYMANSLGCYRSDVFTAIAPVSGGPAGPKPPAPPYPDCTAELPAMIIHGAQDFVIPLSEAETMRDIFAENNGCGPTSSAVDPSPCVAYDDCTSPLHWCEFSGGHEWPGFAAAGVWAFFSAQ
jgi:poly(3-hydroxybutyrate) depolymerase